MITAWNTVVMRIKGMVVLAAMFCSALVSVMGPDGKQNLGISIINFHGLCSGLFTPMAAVFCSAFTGKL